MNKQRFLKSLRARLSHLPRREADERLTFYSEMIDDRIEEGLSEEEAVLAVGSIDEIVSQSTEEQSASEARGKGTPPKKLRAFDIVLLVLGSPIWLSLLISVFAIALSLYAVLWALTASLWALELPFLICVLLSKCLIIACKRATLASLHLTRVGASCTARIFTGKGGRQ